MPRSPANLATVAGPFRGLMSAAHEGLVPPGYATFAIDTDTTAGDLRPRVPMSRVEYSGGAPMINPGPAEPYVRLHRVTDLLWVLVARNHACVFRLDTGGVQYSTSAPHGVNRPYTIVAGPGGRFYIWLSSRDNSLKFRWTGSTVDYLRPGFPPPSNPTLETTSQSGNLISGHTYSYRFCYYNATWGMEGPPSAAVSVVVPTGVSSIRVSMSPPHGSEYGVRGVRLYRLHMGVDATWYRIHEWVSTSQMTSVYQHTDGLADSAVVRSSETTVPTNGDRPPPARLACWHRGRMFWGADDGNLIYVSEAGYPDRVDWTLTLRASRYHGWADPLHQMASDGERLYLFCSRSISVLTGDSPTSFRVSELALGIDPIAYLEPVLMGGALYFAAYSGLYRISGFSPPERLSDPVADIWSHWVWPDGNLSIAAAGEHEAIVICSCMPRQARDLFRDRISALDGDGGVLDGWDNYWQLVYWPGSGQWALWNMDVQAVASGHLGLLYGTRLDWETQNGTSYWRIYRLRDPQHRPRSARCVWRSGHITLGTTRRKRWHHVSSLMERGQAGVVNLRTWTPELRRIAAVAVPATDSAYGQRRALLAPQMRGESLTVQIDSTDPALRVSQIETDAEVIGWR